MPKVCPIFANFEERVKALAAKFVNDQVAAELADPANYVSDRDRLAAFRLLVHAEIEEFMESKAREGLNALSGRISNGAYELRALPDLFVLATAIGEKVEFTPTFDRNSFETQVKKFIKAAEDKISSNNGVKAESFFLLSICSGKMADEVDPTLSVILTSYGKSRGDVAHRSVSRIRTILAPSAEAKAASDIVTGLQKFYDVTS